MLACKLTCKTHGMQVKLQVENKDKITMGLFEEWPISPQPRSRLTSRLQGLLAEINTVLTLELRGQKRPN
jgi:hypothetical protein